MNYVNRYRVPEVSRLSEIIERFPESIFRAYDIRGETDKFLSVDVVYLLGRAIGTSIMQSGSKSLAVGRDCRTSSFPLSQALIKGVTSCGVDVIDVGEVPTPLLYYATVFFKNGNGAMITGSHNPIEFNGIKIMIKGEALAGNQIQDLLAMIKKSAFVNGAGKYFSKSIRKEYVSQLRKRLFNHESSLKVVVDSGNGMASEITPQILRSLGHNVSELYCEIDGSFPNHHPDPSDPNNLVSLSNVVKETSSDIGLAFDGDGDRLGVVNSHGEIIWPDKQMEIFSAEVLKHNKNATVIYDVKCSNGLKHVIQENGGTPIMTRTGHSFVKQKMVESKALLGGEMSGHIFFKDRWFGFDDAIYAACRLLEILSQRNFDHVKILSDLVAKHATPELKVNVDEGYGEGLIKEIKHKIKQLPGEVCLIDGVRVDTKDGWGLVRSSNTTSCLIFRFEGNDEKALVSIKNAFREFIHSLDSSLQLPF